MKLIIIMLVFLSLLFIDVNAPGDVAEDRNVINVCNENGGSCFYDHELNNAQCPDRLPRKVGGEEGEILCNERDEGVEGINCCLPYEEDNGDGNIDEGVTLLSVRNIGTVEVGVNGEEPCCVREGYAPDEGEVCCQGMPRDRGYGVCGCPNDMRWDIDLGCIPQFQRCGYVEERNVCSNWRDILNNLAECLFGGPESKEANRGDLPYEQVCCPYIDYDDQEYYQFENVVVY